MCEACPPENDPGISAETKEKLRRIFGVPKDPHPDTPLAHGPGRRGSVSREEINRRWDTAFGRPGRRGLGLTF